MTADGNCAIVTLISSVVVQTRHASANRLASKCPEASRKLTRFSDAKLQAVSSKNKYSLHGLLALMRPSLGHVCHSLIVVSNCRPGSATCHAAIAIFSQMSAAGIDLAMRPSVRRTVSQLWPASRRAKNSFGMRTELFEF